MIDVEEVDFFYQQTPVLNQFTLKKSDPGICGLWGRNGAGKTTLMNLLAGYERPHKGTISIMGMDPYENLAAQEHLCYIQENHPFGRTWTMKDVFKYGQYFYPNWDGEQAEQFSRIFNLPLNKNLTKFSKGMKTAAQLILGLSSNAAVSILDEPTNGLDAVHRKQFYRALTESYKHHPRLLFISTHHVEEIQPLCESLVVVHAGKVLFHEKMKDIEKRGITLTGAHDSIEKATEHANIIDSLKEDLTTTVMIDAMYSDEWKEMSESLNISINKSSLQDYLVNMTTKEVVMK
ncbi:ABC transporter ATP-binding protein [Bacillus spongiae]|uniref:ABC transporter ATP-binding protein n=1 Tax=Bacillus spongiae TaxID=2683610 RepID=A0ABU8HCJ3_9BACI